MHSIRTKFTLTIVVVILITLSIASTIGVVSIKKLGSADADQMIHLTATTAAMNLEQYFESVEHSVQTVSTLVSDSFEDMPFEELDSQVERARNLFGRIAYNTNGVLTYYFRIDPEISKDIPGFWYVYQDGEFTEHEVTDITQYDTSDTSALVWFTVPKATGEGVWLPPYYTENLGVRVISYNMPVYWNDRFAGVIGIEIDYETLKQEVENTSVFKSGYAFILDEDANVFYHPQLDSAQLNLETTAVNGSEQFIGSNHVRYTYEGVEKEAVWIGLSNGMRLYVCAPVAEINSGWTGMIWDILIALLAILVVSVIAMMRFAGRITKPLRDLTEAAKQADEGNYDFTVEYDKDDEIGILTHTFKQLAANTKEKITEMEELDQQKITINDLLMDCITILRRNGNYEVACNELLDLVASFYGADRSYIFEFDLGSQRMSNTYEWCAEGIEAEISKLQNMDIAIVDRWIAQFEAHGEFYINSTDGELDHDSDEYKILAMQDIQSLMAAPLRLGGDIVGFLGVDNPRANTNTLLVLQAVSSFVVNQLGKQREEQQQLMLSALTDDYDVLIRSDIDRDTFAVLRTNDSYKEHCPNLYAYRSLSAFLEQISHLNEEEYESFHTHVNRESIIQHLTQEQALYHNFRLADQAGNSTTYQIKIVPVGAWPESRRILLGIHNIEETVRAEESQRRMLEEALDKAERIQHSLAQHSAVIEALTRVYDSVWLIDDSETEHFQLYRIDENMSHLLPAQAAAKLTKVSDAFAFYSNLVLEEDRQGFLEAVRLDNIIRNTENRLIYSVPFRRVFDSGIRYYRVEFARLVLEDDLFNIVLGFKDVDEEVRKEQQIQQTLREAIAAANASNNAKTSFLSNMSHEIRTPMNAIIGLDNIALNDPDLTPHIKEQLEKIGASAKHLLGIINDILDMSRIESGRMELRDEEFSFREFLDQINVMVSGQCADKGLQYDCRIIGKTEDYYVGDEMKLKQVLINILGNAVKFTQAPGSVTFTVEQTTGFENYRSLRFIISDTGIGMSKDYIPKIFEAFSQETEGTSNKLGSTGLGMAITKNIVSMMNGDIAVESEKGVGSTFTVTVTLKASARSAHAVHSEMLPTGLQALVVDDDLVAREHAQLVAESIGIRTEIAADAAEALAMIRARMAQGEPYRLVLPAWKMSGMDGIAFTRELRGIDGGEAMVILLTGYDWEDAREEADRAGVDAILSKPLFNDSLTHCVQTILSRREQNAEIAPDPTAEQDDPVKAGLEGCLVLVVEDMELNAEILMDLLDLEGIRSEHAENGQIAVDMFLEHPAGYYDAILMDVRMPVMDGLEATCTIRALDRPDAKRIPIIAMTANAFDEDVQQSLQAGMNAHLSKPVETERLFELLGRMIQRGEEAQSSCED